MNEGGSDANPRAVLVFSARKGVTHLPSEYEEYGVSWVALANKRGALAWGQGEDMVQTALTTEPT